MHVNDFIKWTGKDDEGTFSHVGQIISQNDTWIEFKTKHGVMCVRRTDGKFEPSAPVELKSEQKAKPTLDQPKREVKVGSKLEQCIEIYKTMKGASRKELIAEFVAKVGMTEAGASTYAAQVKKVA